MALDSSGSAASGAAAIPEETADAPSNSAPGEAAVAGSEPFELGPAMSLTMKELRQHRISGPQLTYFSWEVFFKLESGIFLVWDPSDFNLAQISLQMVALVLEETLLRF